MIKLFPFLVCCTFTLFFYVFLFVFFFSDRVYAQSLHEDSQCSDPSLRVLSLTEGDTEREISLYYNNAGREETLQFQTVENTRIQDTVARENVDYTLNEESLSLSSSDMCTEVKLGTIIGDDVSESPEVFTVGLFIDGAEDTSLEIEITLIDDEPLTWSILANNVSIASVQEGVRLSVVVFYQGTLPENTTSVSFTIRQSFTVQGYAASQPEDFVQTLSEALRSVSGITVRTMTEHEVRVTFPVSREERTFRGITFSFRIAVDDRTEAVEAFTLELGDVSTGVLGIGRVLGLIILGGASVLDDVSALTTYLTLQASVQNLSSAVHKQVTQVLRDKVPHTPLVTDDSFRMHLRGLREGESDGDGELYSDWDIWSSGTFTAVRGGFPKRDFVKSEVVNVWLGLDYRITRSFVAGTLFGYESSSGTVDSFNARLEGRGTALGVYVGGEVWREVIGDLSFVWMGLGYESRGSNGTVNTTADFSGRRFMVAGNLRGRWQDGGLWLDPVLGFLWGYEWQEHYEDSLDFDIEERTFVVGQFFFGPELGYQWSVGEGGVVESFVGIRGVYTFESKSYAATVPIQVRGDVFGFDRSEFESVGINFGVTREWGENLRLQLRGSYGGLGTHTEMLSGSFLLSYSWNETLRLLLRNDYGQGGEWGIRTTLQWTF